MKRPQSGKLRHLVTWQIPSSAPVDGSCGQDVTTWSVQGIFWAEVTPSGVPIPFNAGQLKPLRIQQIRMRGGPAIAAGHQLVFEGRPLTVNEVEREDERPFWLLIKAIEQQSQGVAGGP
jgi:head-tail adaptor